MIFSSLFDWHFGLYSAFFNLAPQLFNFFFEGLIFRDLACKEMRRRPGFFGDTAVGQKVNVGLLVLAVPEVVGLDQAFVDQRLQAVVNLAEADAERAPEAALAHLWIGFEQPQNFVAILVRKHGGGAFND